MSQQTITAVPRRTRNEVVFAACYFATYMGYLFLHPEGELLHWLTLVLLPLLGVFHVGRYSGLTELLSSIGLRGGRLRAGFGWMLVLAAGFQVIQLLNERQRLEFLAIIREPFGFLLPLLALALLLVTVASTEEVFFRGVLQTRLADRYRSQLVALVLATLAFIVYHVPYAYLNPAWPSAGDFPAALRVAAINGGVGGAALGLVYWRSGNNLVAAVLLHAGIDLIPATRLVHELIRGSS